MGAFKGAVLTQQGLALQMKAQNGTKLIFSRIAIGDGVFTGDLTTLVTLINELKSLQIEGLKIEGGNSRIKTSFNNTGEVAGYYIKEIGLFATDPDEGEILYSVTNVGDGEADYIPAESENIVEELIEFVTLIGNAADVTAVIDKSLVYAKYEDFEEIKSNLENEVLNYKNIIKTTIHSGYLDLGNLEFDHTEFNKMKINESKVNVNGDHIIIPEQYLDCGELPSADFISSSGRKGYREDLVFLEVWKERGIDSNDIETKSRIRVVEDVDFVTFKTDGFCVSSYLGSTWDNVNAVIGAQGGNSDLGVINSRSKFIPHLMVNNTAFVRNMEYDDYGLYIAGTGDSTSKDELKTYDGFVYVIPLFKINRRNNEGYTQDNPNGGRDYYTLSFTTSFDVVKGISYTATADNTSEALKIKVGDVLKLTTTYIEIENVNGVEITFKNIDASTKFWESYIHSLDTPVEHRPDDKFANIVYESDIADLRHKVSLDGVDTEMLLKQSMNQALAGELAPVKMKKQYMGIKKTPIDEYTILYASMDGDIEPEVGGLVADTLTTKRYHPSPTGLGIETYSASSSRGIVYKPTRNANSNELSIEFDLYNDKKAGVTTSDSLLLLYNEETPGVYFKFGLHSNGLLRIHSSSGSICYLPYIELSEGWHSYKFEFGKMYIDGVQLEYGGFLDMTVDADFIDIDIDTLYVVADSNYPSRLISNLTISDVERGKNFPSLPQDFIDGEAELKSAFSGQRQSYGEPLSGQATVGIARAEEISAINLDIVLPNGVKNTFEGSQYKKTLSNTFSFDGSESWTEYGNTKGVNSNLSMMKLASFFANNDIVADVQAMAGGNSDQVAFENVGTSVDAVAHALETIAGNLYILIPTAELATDDLDGLKGYLASKPVTANFQLIEPKTYHKDSLNASRGLTKTQATEGLWASGDTIKVKGEAGEIISGVMDIDSALAKIVDFVDGYNITLDDVSKLSVGDTFYCISPNNDPSSMLRTISAIDSVTKQVTFTGGATTIGVIGYYLVETTASTSAPRIEIWHTTNKNMNPIAGTWSGLGTNEATFTIAADLASYPYYSTSDIVVAYSLNTPEHEGKIPVYDEILEGVVNGKKLVKSGTITITDDFKGKTKGLLLSNPHVSKTGATNTLLIPSASTLGEIDSISYESISELNQVLRSVVTSSSPYKAQHVFSFDLVRIVEDKFGEIPAVDKIKWLRDNISTITVAWHGFGSNPNGNSANVALWDRLAVAYLATGARHTPSVASSPMSILVTATETVITNTIDDSGNVHAIAYTEASDGVTPSTIHTDYVNIEIVLKSDVDFDILAPANARRDAGRSNVLLVKKETREIKTLFSASNEDEIAIIGNVRLPYEQFDRREAMTVLAQNPHYLVTDLNSANGEKYGSHPWSNPSWRFLMDSENVLGEFGYGHVSLAAESIDANMGMELDMEKYGFTFGYVMQRSLEAVHKRMVGFIGQIVLHEGELKLFVIVQSESEGQFELGGIADSKAFLISLKNRPLVKMIKGPRRSANIFPTFWRTPSRELLI